MDVVLTKYIWKLLAIVIMWVKQRLIMKYGGWNNI